MERQHRDIESATLDTTALMKAYVVTTSSVCGETCCEKIMTAWNSHDLDRFKKMVKKAMRKKHKGDALLKAILHSVKTIRIYRDEGPNGALQRLLPVIRSERVVGAIIAENFFGATPNASRAAIDLMRLKEVCNG